MARKKAATSDGTPRPNSAGGQLRSFIERIERLEEEKKTIMEDIKDVYGEAKGTGYEPKAIRKIIAERKADHDALMEFEAIVDTYRAALGMLPPESDEEIEADETEGDSEGESLV